MADDTLIYTIDFINIEFHETFSIFNNRFKGPKITSLVYPNPFVACEIVFCFLNSQASIVNVLIEVDDVNTDPGVMIFNIKILFKKEVYVFETSLDILK